VKEKKRPAWAQELIDRSNRPRTPEEQARWDRAVENADRLRVKVGRDFNIVAEIRKIREHGESLD